MQQRRSWTLAWALAMTAAGLTPALAQDPPAERPRRTPNLITAEEIKERAPTAAHAKEIIDRLRPQWVRNRRPAVQMSNMSTTPRLRVYIDGIQVNDPNALETITRESILELQFVSGIDASTRFGVDHELGAVLVRTNRGR